MTLEKAHEFAEDISRAYPGRRTLVFREKGRRESYQAIVEDADMPLDDVVAEYENGERV